MSPVRLLLVALLVAPSLAGCTSDQPGTAREAAFRPPDTSAFRGACELVADDLVALGRSAAELRGQDAPSKAARDALATAQDRVDAVAETADATRRPALQKLVVATGLARIQADTGHLEPDTTENLSSAYQAAVTACTAPAAPASPSASAG